MLQRTINNLRQGPWKFLLVLLSVALAGAAAAGAVEPSWSLPIPLSGVPDTGLDGGSAAKGRLLGLSYDTPQGFAVPLLAAYVDGMGPTVWSFDASSHAARDVFVTRSTDGGATWSQARNLSLSANLSSLDVDHDGDPETPPQAYAGDVEKPNLFANGRRILLAWISRYCPSGQQRSVRYPEAGGIEVPYACLWSSRSTDGGMTWSAATPMTDGYRDAKQESIRGSGAGFMALLQQDPRGLQPGEAEGPGEGGSGAQVSRGTDIWWSSLRTVDFEAGDPFPPTQRLTDNHTLVDTDGYESGTTGASRPNFFLDGGIAVVAYEETKGSGGDGEGGKYLRYHAYSAFDSSLPDSTAGAGCIVSQVGENARRARLVGQPGPSKSSSALRLFIFWRQGIGTQGAPADIVGRVGRLMPGDPSSTGLRPEDLQPAVHPDCLDADAAADNAQPLNLSSRAGLTATTSDDALENARAHRAVLRGDLVFLAWTGLPSPEGGSVPRPQPNFDLYVRRSTDGGQTWLTRDNVSRLPWSRHLLLEPRLVATPFASNPAEYYDPNVLYAVWSLEVVPDGPEGPVLDSAIFFTRTTDAAASWDPVRQLAGGPGFHFESQARTDPDGQRLYVVWQQRTSEEPEVPASTTVDTMFRTVDFAHVFSDGFESGDTSRWDGVED